MKVWVSHLAEECRYTCLLHFDPFEWTEEEWEAREASDE